MPRKQYYADHRDKQLENNKKYYQDNKERLKLWHKEYYKAHPESGHVPKEKQRENYKRYRSNFLEMYGNKCACCGETIKEFLTIEHKLGQAGIKRQSSSKAYREAVKNYNTEIYEILCMNCNHAKGKYGFCPHQTS